MALTVVKFLCDFSRLSHDFLRVQSWMPNHRQDGVTEKFQKNGPIQVVVVGQVAPPNTEFRDRLLVDLLQV